MIDGIDISFLSDYIAKHKSNPLRFMKKANLYVDISSKLQSSSYDPSYKFQINLLLENLELKVQ